MTETKKTTSKKPTSKRPSSKKAKTKSEPADLKRMVENKTKEVTLSFGEYTVKDLGLMDVITLMAKYADIVTIFMGIVDDMVEPTAADILGLFTFIPDVKGKLAFLFALCCGVEDDAEEIQKFKASNDDDVIELINSIVEIVDFQRVKSNFLALNLRKIMPS